MEKILWAIWKYLKHYSIYSLLLVFGNVHASEVIDYTDCDLGIVKSHPIQECIQRYNKKLSSLSRDTIQHYEEEFKRLEENHNLMNMMDYNYLFKYYPEPKLLFSELNLGIEAIKQEPDVAMWYDCPDCSGIRQNRHYVLLYQIIIGMLQDKKPLNAHEQLMLETSKQYEQCLSNILDDLRNDPDKIIHNKDITEKCYNR